MTASILFLLGLGMTLVTTFAIVAYLRTSLHNILVELCGTRERAAFWVSFSNVTISLVPLIFAMQYTPDFEAGSAALFELAGQLKWALVGLLVAVLILGWVLRSFIRREDGPSKTNQAPAATVV
jgi:hypothetical protein